MNENTINYIKKERDELEIKYEQTKSRFLDIENKYNLVMASTKDLR